ncbi:MAG TPA: outer membrane beta-barrel protein [Chryseosolibacter sp.]|nr:outer membrane beta-barrel protein [Chryseosolibacter sp.]
MKMLTLILLTFLSTSAFAQGQYFYLTLDFAKPLANTEWIGDMATRGARVGYRSFINDKISAGLDLGWNTYDQYNPTETRETGNTAITTDYFKYIYSYSATVSGQYNFEVGEGDRFHPYAGLGLGAVNQQHAIYYNIYHDSERSWGFLARPEAGILVRLSRYGSFGLMGAIHYDYSTNKSPKFNYGSFSALGFQLGIVFIEL